MKINKKAPQGAFDWTEPFDPIKAFEGAHGSLAADFNNQRMNAKFFESKVKKSKMLELTSVDDKKHPKVSAMAGTYTAYATNNPESKLVRIYSDGKWDIDPAIPHSRTSGVISE
jgi:hypothetical protein